jgi:peptidyl-prolyl cis-trans isomerase B (cyclophilin B)
VTTNDLSQPQPQPIYGQGPRPAHDGMAIAAFVTCWFVPLLGVIFGHISNHKAKVEGRAKDGLATAGVILGYVFSAIYVLAIVLTVTLATMAANTPLPGATG